ncbi:MAG: Hpt domain-containing protein [Phycisphaerales bacterium]
MNSQAREGHTAADEVIRSTFADDPDMRELVKLFVSELPSKLAEVLSALESEDLDGLRSRAHMLRGSCGGYGFAQIGAAAGRIESELIALSADGVERDSSIQSVRKQVAELADLCRRATAARPEKSPNVRK